MHVSVQTFWLTIKKNGIVKIIFYNQKVTMGVQSESVSLAWNNSMQTLVQKCMPVAENMALWFIYHPPLTRVSIQSTELDPMTPWVATCTETGGLIRWQLNHLIHNSVFTKLCDLVSIMTPSCNNVLWLTWLAQFLFARVIINITYRHEDIHNMLKIKKIIKQSLYFLKYMQVDCIQ